MSTRGGGNQRQRSASGATYDPKTGLPQDMADTRPPFSMEQFAAATLRPVESSGYNRSYQATIGGQRYLVKEMRDAADSVHGAYARHSAYADAVGSRIAHLAGVGEVVVPTYAFEHNGRYYVASRYLNSVRAAGAGSEGGRFSAGDVQRLLSAEPEITRLLRANGLESGIPGLQARMGVLRAMLASGNLTQQGLNEQVNAWIRANTPVPGTMATPPAPAASPPRGGGLLNRFRRGG